MGRIRGWIGEQKAKLRLWAFLSSKTYHRVHNLIIPSLSGTTQIDHLVISKYGLFIIETKNKAGWIFGSADHSKWTQVIYKNKYSFQNPLRQTYRQKKVLADFLEINESLIHLVIYFVGKCTFKTRMPENVLRTGLFRKGPARYIKGYKTPMLSEEEVYNITQRLKVHKSSSGLTTKQHIRSLKERHASTTHCPRCGSDLVVRTISKGPRASEKFLGCSTFPKCRFTKQVTG